MLLLLLLSDRCSLSLSLSLLLLVVRHYNRVLLLNVIRGCGHDELRFGCKCAERTGVTGGRRVRER